MNGLEKCEHGKAKMTCHICHDSPRMETCIIYPCPFCAIKNIELNKLRKTEKVVEAAKTHYTDKNFNNNSLAITSFCSCIVCKAIRSLVEKDGEKT